MSQYAIDCYVCGEKAWETFHSKFSSEYLADLSHVPCVKAQLLRLPEKTPATPIPPRRPQYRVRRALPAKYALYDKARSAHGVYRLTLLGLEAAMTGQLKVHELIKAMLYKQGSDREWTLWRVHKQACSDWKSYARVPHHILDLLHLAYMNRWMTRNGKLASDDEYSVRHYNTRSRTVDEAAGRSVDKQKRLEP